MKQLRIMAQDAMKQINKTVYGKEVEIQEIMATFIGGVHVLLENIMDVERGTEG